MSKVHELKILSEYFKSVLDGTKTFELRLNDRDYQVGDTLILKEYYQGDIDYKDGIYTPPYYTNKQIKKKIAYMFEGGQYGLQEGYCILGLENFKSEVKFYEFNDFEYYALIAVDAEEKYPMEVAIAAYKEEIADIDEYEKQNTPDEITLDEALERYKKGNIERFYTEEEKIKDFYEQIELDVEHEQDYTILLISSYLC